MSKKTRRRGRGCYCWCCDRVLSTSDFKKGGRKNHICRECHKLGSEELALRQDERDLEQCCDWDGIISRKRRKSFERFLNHPNSLIRLLAQAIQQDDLESRAESASRGRIWFEDDAEDQALESLISSINCDVIIDHYDEWEWSRDESSAW